MDGVLGDPDFGVWGIYDGHLSHTLSEYLSQRLIKEFVADFKAAGKPNHLSKKFFENLFTRVNKEYMAQGLAQAGSCAVLVIV